MSERIGGASLPSPDTEAGSALYTTGEDTVVLPSHGGKHGARAARHLPCRGNSPDTESAAGTTNTASKKITADTWITAGMGIMVRQQDQSEAPGSP